MILNKNNKKSFRLRKTSLAKKRSQYITFLQNNRTIDEYTKWTKPKEKKHEWIYDSWENYNLETGEIINNTGNVNKLEYNNINNKEVKDIKNEDNNNEKELKEEEIYNKILGLELFCSCLKQARIPYTLNYTNNNNSFINVSKKTFSITVGTNISFYTENYTCKAVLFSVKFKTLSNLPTKKGIDFCIPVADNCYRQCIVYIKKDRVCLLHCGWQRYSLNKLLPPLLNINSILHIAKSRIKEYYSNSSVNLYCNELLNLNPHRMQPFKLREYHCENSDTIKSQNKFSPTTLSISINDLNTNSISKDSTVLADPFQDIYRIIDCIKSIKSLKQNYSTNKPKYYFY